MDAGDPAPAPLAAVDPTDLTETTPRFASAEPTARFLNALLAKVEALEAQQQVERKAAEAQAAEAAAKIQALEAQQKATEAKLEAENRALKAGLVPLTRSDFSSISFPPIFRPKTMSYPAKQR